MYGSTAVEDCDAYINRHDNSSRYFYYFKAILLSEKTELVGILPAMKQR
jgi:hypothetical protein